MIVSFVRANILIHGFGLSQNNLKFLNVVLRKFQFLKIWTRIFSRHDLTHYPYDEAHCCHENFFTSIENTYDKHKNPHLDFSHVVGNNNTSNPYSIKNMTKLASELIFNRCATSSLPQMYEFERKCRVIISIQIFL